MFSVRKAQPKDAEAVAVLIYDAIEDLAELFTGETGRDAALCVLAGYVSGEGTRFSCRNCLVAANEEGKVAGMVLFYAKDMLASLDGPIRERLAQLGKPAELPVECEDGEIYIDSVAVSPEFRGLGLAELLIRAAGREAAKMGYPRLSLLVDEKKERVKALYERIGFRAEGGMEIKGHRYHRMAMELGK